MIFLCFYFEDNLYLKQIDHYLDCGDDFIDVYICQNVLNRTL